jgi:hypothetical protein
MIKKRGSWEIGGQLSAFNFQNCPLSGEYADNFFFGGQFWQKKIKF